MFDKKFISTILIAILIVTGCSVVDKIKEKVSSGQKEIKDTKEAMKDASSDEDMNFYNEYIEVLNKSQETGEQVYKDYLSTVPEPKSITKNSLIIPVALQIYVGNLERNVKEFKRSYYDGGELSKLNASKEMKDKIENIFKNLIVSMEEYHSIASKVSGYYTKREYKNDLSKASIYDEELKDSYNKFKKNIDELSVALRQYKPKREIVDPNTISDPDERSSTIMLNAYGNILDAAEKFYDSYKNLNYKDDLFRAKSDFNEFEKIYNENKDNILKAEFTDRTKSMKYSFEDYFSKMANNFFEAGKRFFDYAPNASSENSFSISYNEVINDYNSMITSYNTSISSINMIRRF